MQETRLPRYTGTVLETLPLHHLTRTISLLAHGEIVAYPTGTSYGLGVNALDERAVRRLSDLKQRPEDKTYTVLLPQRNPERFVAWNEGEQRVFSALRDRPLTLLVQAKPPLAHLAKDGRVGIRTPDHPFTKLLVDLLPFPVTATSANLSGENTACSPGDIETSVKSVRLYAVEGGTLPRCASSTVASWNGSAWTIVRKGDVTKQELERA